MSNFTKLTFGVFFALSLCNVYAEDNKPELDQPQPTAPSKGDVGSKTIRLPIIEQMKVGNGTIQKMPYSPGYYAIFENGSDGSRFREVTISRPPTIKEFQKQEILYITRNLEFAEPDFRDKAHPEKNGEFTCMSGVLRTRRDNNTTDYNPCESTLTDKSFNAAKSATFAVLTLGLGAVTGTGSSTMTVNSEKVKSIIGIDVMEAVVKLTVSADCATEYSKIESCRAVQEKFSSVISEELTDHISKGRLAQYRGLYAKAKTSTELEKFRTSFAGDDMELLAVKAEQDIPLVKRQEWLTQYRQNFAAADNVDRLEMFIKTYSSDDPDKLIPKAQSAFKSESARLAKIQRKSDEIEKQYEVQLVNWRRNLKIGDDTFCGPVVEIRLPMIKIAVSAQLQGYAPEAWLKADQVFPPTLGCRNTNGRLAPLKS